MSAEGSGAKAGLSKAEVEQATGLELGAKAELVTGNGRTFAKASGRWFELDTKPAPFVGGE